MYKGPILFLWIVGAILAWSCTKSVQEVQMTNVSENPYEISEEKALQALESFLREGNLSTKASILERGSYSIKKWTGSAKTKGLEDYEILPVYCVEFEENQGSALLAADTRQEEKIFCVTENSRITVQDLELAEEQVINATPVKLAAPTDTTSIEGWDENFVVAFVARNFIRIPSKKFDIHSDGGFDLGPDSGADDSEADGGDIQDDNKEGDSGTKEDCGLSNGQWVPSSEDGVIKYDAFLRTKWGQNDPFNLLMKGTKVGCVPVATAQVIFYNHNHLNVSTYFQGLQCGWDVIGSVYSVQPNGGISEGTESAKQQVSHFMLDVKTKCGMKITHNTGTVWDVERGLEKFGFKNVYHKLAVSGGSPKDRRLIEDVVSMLENHKPVVMCAFCAQPWYKPWKWVGHTYVIDGYKKDSTGEYLHINWGWKGSQDGYYAKGCFNESARQSIEDGLDPGDADEDPSNFSTSHYYV